MDHRQFFIALICVLTILSLVAATKCAEPVKHVGKHLTITFSDNVPLRVPWRPRTCSLSWRNCSNLRKSDQKMWTSLLCTAVWKMLVQRRFVAQSRRWNLRARWSMPKPELVRMSKWCTRHTMFVVVNIITLFLWRKEKFHWI